MTRIRVERFATGGDGVGRLPDGRVEPACLHYVADRCGGCQLQHVSIDAQLEAKRTIVGDALRRWRSATCRVEWCGTCTGGVGDTARTLALAGAKVWCGDMDRSAMEWARFSGGPEVTYVAARVEDALGRLPEPHAVVANPPRAGLAGRVTTRLDRWARVGGERRLCYLSCDPATLARDVKRMPALRIVRLLAFDLFPQTAHVETLAVLEAA